MLFDLLIGGLEMLSDTIEYGPAKAFEINTSVCPQAERDTIRINRELQKELKASAYDDGLEVGDRPVRRTEKDFVKHVSQGTTHISESVVEKEEEAIIDQAVAEKGRW